MMDDILNDNTNILEQKESESGSEKGAFVTDNSEYKKSWWENKGKKYKRITITFDEEDFNKIESLTKKTKYKSSEVAKKACLQTLNNLQNEFSQNKDDVEKKQHTIKEALQIFRNLGTNINQITKDLNERRLSDKFFNNNLTKAEKNNILTTVERLEIEVLKFIKSNL
jgi:chromosome segregation ATPase